MLLDGHKIIIPSLVTYDNTTADVDEIELTIRDKSQCWDGDDGERGGGRGT